MTSEIFRNLSVRGTPAVVTHTICCNGVYWDVTWYEAAVNVSYSMSFQQDIARAYGYGNR